MRMVIYDSTDYDDLRVVVESATLVNDGQRVRPHVAVDVFHFDVGENWRGDFVIKALPFGREVSNSSTFELYVSVGVEVDLTRHATMLRGRASEQRVVSVVAECDAVGHHYVLRICAAHIAQYTLRVGLSHSWQAIRQ